MGPTKWDYRFMDVAEMVASWSKDPSTKVGAVAVRDRQILATGYNGFPRGIDDSEERLYNRPYKYDMTVHAELNCVMNAQYNGVSLRSADLYVFGLPVCSNCAKALVQVGLNSIFIRARKKSHTGTDWEEDFKTTKRILEEVDIPWYRMHHRND